jgi:hypothetical protein
VVVSGLIVRCPLAAREIGVNMANMDARTWRDSGIQSRSITNPVEIQSRFRTSTAHDTVKLSDDDLDFPSADHPVRELISFCIFVSGVIALLVWGGSKLLQAIF